MGNTRGTPTNSLKEDSSVASRIKYFMQYGVWCECPSSENRNIFRSWDSRPEDTFAAVTDLSAQLLPDEVRQRLDQSQFVDIRVLVKNETTGEASPLTQKKEQAESQRKKRSPIHLPKEHRQKRKR